MDKQKIWFHGTRTKKIAEKIKRNGFAVGTYFGRHMEDAVGYGGPYVFWVKIRFPEAKSSQWEVVSSNQISHENIIGSCYVENSKELKKRLKEI